MSRPTWLKAIVGGLLAFSTWGVTALAPDETGVVGVSGAEWFGLVGVLAAALGVYAAKNGESIDSTTSTPEV